jgi:hypothetical protein
MKHFGWMLLCLMLALPACGGDEKSSEDRAKEAQRAMQEGVQKERQMYEGMQKGVEGLERKAQEKAN